MDPVQTAYPVSTTGACSLTFVATARQSKGVGSFSSTSPVSFTSLVIAFPAGRDDVKSVEFLRELCVQHLLNNPSFVSWWNPEIGTIESNLRDALSSCQPPHSYSTGPSWGLMFDGQYGPVLAA